MSFLNELRRRNVLRVGAAYVVTAWLVVQVVETLFPIYGFSDAAARTVVNILAIGLVPVLVLSWVFEWTPEGLQRDSEVDAGAPSTLAAAKRLDRIILVVLALASGYFAFDKFVLDPARDVEIAETARQEGRSEAIVESYGDASIAVLAFADMSPDKDQEYLSDGIAEEVLHLLEKIEGLRVISRTSAFSFKGKDTPIPEIARQLNVAHVLEGSVRKAGDRIRVTAQLIEAGTDTHIWSQSYDRTLDDIFAIQDDLAAAMVEQLQVNLLGALPTKQRVDPEAYLLYLEGHHLAYYGNAQRAVDLLEQAVAIEPDYFEAWLDLSAAYYNLSPTASKLVHEGDEYWDKQLMAYGRAREINPQHPVILASDAWDAMNIERDVRKTARLLESAVLATGNNFDASHYLSVMMRWFGREDISLALLKPFLAKDPLCRNCLYRYGRALFLAGRYEEAIEHLRRFRSLNPGTSGFIMIILSHLMLGDSDAARDLLEQNPPRAGDRTALPPSQWAQADLMTRLVAGRREGVTEEIERLESDPEVRLDPRSFAELYALNDQPDKAFKWLRTAVTDYQPDEAATAVRSPFLKSLHDDPRWQKLLEEIGVAQHQLAEISFDPQLPD